MLAWCDLTFMLAEVSLSSGCSLLPGHFAGGVVLFLLHCVPLRAADQLVEWLCRSRMRFEFETQSMNSGSGALLMMAMPHHTDTALQTAGMGKMYRTTYGFMTGNTFAASKSMFPCAAKHRRYVECLWTAQVCWAPVGIWAKICQPLTGTLLDPLTLQESMLSAQL